MNSRNKLVHFMYEKRKRITNLGLNGDLVFSSRDYIIIYSWDKETCDIVWNQLVENITILKSNGLSHNVCPFCIRYNRNCEKCKYAEEHGVCISSSNMSFISDHQKIKQLLVSVGKNHKQVFSRRFYENILEELK